MRMSPSIAPGADEKITVFRIVISAEPGSPSRYPLTQKKPDWFADHRRRYSPRRVHFHSVTSLLFHALKGLVGWRDLFGALHYSFKRCARTAKAIREEL